MKCGPFTLLDFAAESNEIEGIYNDDRHEEHTRALAAFLTMSNIAVADLEEFVYQIEPGAFLRTKREHQVVVGDHVAPEPILAGALLVDLLKLANARSVSAHQAHLSYEHIHPFIDGNGRSGRALWLWLMVRSGWKIDALPRLFLQEFYYQTLQAADESK